MSDDISKQIVEEASDMEPPANPVVEFVGWMKTHADTVSNKNRICRLCGTLWTAGDWNFYDLCPTCFEEFDRQKMLGRMPTIGTQPRLGVDYFESGDAWMEKRRKERSTS